MERSLMEARVELPNILTTDTSLYYRAAGRIPVEQTFQVVVDSGVKRATLADAQTAGDENWSVTVGRQRCL